MVKRHLSIDLRVKYFSFIFRVIGTRMYSLTLLVPPMNSKFNPRDIPIFDPFCKEITVGASMCSVALENNESACETVTWKTQQAFDFHC